jgi:hypothetical protein
MLQNTALLTSAPSTACAQLGTEGHSRCNHAVVAAQMACHNERFVHSLQHTNTLTIAETLYILPSRTRSRSPVPSRPREVTACAV